VKKKAKTGGKKEAPVFDLHAFGEKANWTDFYIQDLKTHIREHTFIGRPHKHDFYLLMFTSQGSGIHIIDFVEYKIEPDTVFLMTPGQVHTWTLSGDIEGFVIFFTRDFYQMHLSENSLLEFPFFHSLDASAAVRIEKNKPIQFSLQQMSEEYNASRPNLRLIRAYLDVLLLEVAKYYRASRIEQTLASTQRLRKLEKLIDEKFRTLKQPSDYAELMNMTPSHLNSICKEALGKTVTDLIQQRILLEAKRMFSYSDQNINEVATKLGFADPSYFIRWFKKQMNQTPDDFRKQLSIRHV
jgi:AraC family transcriptional regulator, transcriptional activator of pobA